MPPIDDYVRLAGLLQQPDRLPAPTCASTSQFQGPHNSDLTSDWCRAYWSLEMSARLACCSALIVSPTWPAQLAGWLRNVKGRLVA